MNNVMTVRNRDIAELRANGWTLRAIAEKYGISIARTRQIAIRKDRHLLHGRTGMSVRTENCIRNALGILDRPLGADDVRRFLSERPGKSSLSLPYFGVKSLREAHAFALAPAQVEQA